MVVHSTMHATLAAKAAKAMQVAESQPRPSRVNFTVSIRGAGETRLIGNRAIQFGVMMLDEPAFSYGVIATGPVAQGAMPMATAIVLDYVKNQNGLYVGAEMGFVVDSLDTNISLKFSLTYEAAAFRASVGTDATLGENSATMNEYRGTV